MLRLTKIKEKEMTINDIFMYIEKNSPVMENRKISRHEDKHGF